MEERLSDTEARNLDMTQVQEEIESRENKNERTL